MPCISGPSYPETDQTSVFLDAACCALWNTLQLMQLSDEDIISRIDFAEAGISEADLRAWRQRHRARDEARRQAEALRIEQARLAREREAIAQAALQKLTPEERAALGLHSRSPRRSR